MEPLEALYKKGALKNFAKFTGKHLGQSLFFNKVAGLRPRGVLKSSHPEVLLKIVVLKKWNNSLENKSSRVHI